MDCLFLLAARSSLWTIEQSLEWAGELSFPSCRTTFSFRRSPFRRTALPWEVPGFLCTRSSCHVVSCALSFSRYAGAVAVLLGPANNLLPLPGSFQALIFEGNVALSPPVRPLPATKTPLKMEPFLCHHNHSILRVHISSTALPCRMPTLWVSLLVEAFSFSWAMWMTASNCATRF